MTFPAWQRFDGDPRVTPRTLRVYRWCRDWLDFCEPREAKLVVVAHATGIHETKVSPSLAWLIRQGYVVEHTREGPRAPRRLTLAWSVGAAIADPATPEDAAVPRVA